MQTTPEHRPDVRSDAEAVYLGVRELLVSGSYPPGTRLSERKLSVDFGTSRTPVREALRQLQSDGLVRGSGRGAIVVALTPAEVRDAYRTRAALEALSAELAAERCRGGLLAPTQLTELARRAEEVEQAAWAADARAASIANLRFHQWIADLANNYFVTEALGRLWDRIAVSSLSNLTDPTWGAEVAEHHRTILSAIADGDGELAASMTRTHVQRAADVFTSHAEEGKE